MLSRDKQIHNLQSVNQSYCQIKSYSGMADVFRRTDVVEA